MADHNEFGNKAEEQAIQYLVEKGYQILEKNYRFQKAEIDIIAKFLNEIVIIEVKARSTDAFIEPQEAVNKKKIKLIVTAANEYIQQNNRVEEARFDIISILRDDNGKLTITHIENAFEAIDAN